MSRIKQIRTERWSEHLSIFTNGNRGRKVTIKLFNPNEGEELIAHELPFMAIDYDAINKGDDMVISCGEKTLELSHAVDAPVELWETHDNQGVVTTLKIIDQNNQQCILHFT